MLNVLSCNRLTLLFIIQLSFKKNPANMLDLSVLCHDLTFLILELQEGTSSPQGEP